MILSASGPETIDDDARPPVVGNLRVLLVSPLPPPEGGISTWTQQVVNAVKSTCPDIELRVLDTAVRWRGVTQQSMPVRLTGGSAHALGQLWRLRRMARTWRPDVVHICTSGGTALVKDVLMLRWCRANDIPAVIHFRFGRIPDVVRQGGREWFMLRRAIRMSVRAFVLDRRTFNVLRPMFGKRIARLPNFIDVDAMAHQFGNGKATLAEKKAKSVVFVGHVLPSKGVRELVAGCRKLAGEFPELQLRIVGPYSPPFRDELMQLAGGEQSGARWLEFSGPVPREQALRHMAEADVFCLPTYTEGFPNSVLEAMAMGKPIVATPVGAVPEMLHFGGRNPCGVAAPARNPEGIAEALRQIFHDPERAKRMAQRAQQRCRRAYDAPRNIARLTRFWDQTSWLPYDADNGGYPLARRGKPRTLVINQVAGPLTVELLARLSQRGWDCQVLCGEIESEAGLPADVEVIRSTKLIKSTNWRRLWTWVRFTWDAVVVALNDRDRAVIVVTNPPFTMLAMAVLRRLVGVRFALLVHDLYPDVAERMNVIRPHGIIARTWRALSRTALTQANTVVVIGELMGQLLREHLHSQDHINLRVIPTWVNTNFIRPVTKTHNPFVEVQNLADKFVVMYSGAFGATHHLQTFIDAAALLVDVPDIHFVLIGGGTSAHELQKILAARPLPNVTLLGFQPWESIPFSLGAADCSVVSLDAAYGGVSMPSKAYYALAAGSALIAVAPDESELSALVQRHDCGVRVRPHDAADLASAVRALYHDPGRLSVLRENARRTAERHYSFVQLDRLCDELTWAVGQPSSRRSLLADVPSY